MKWMVFTFVQAAEKMHNNLHFHVLRGAMIYSLLRCPCFVFVHEINEHFHPNSEKNYLNEIIWAETFTVPCLWENQSDVICWRLKRKYQSLSISWETSFPLIFFRAIYKPTIEVCFVIIMLLDDFITLSISVDSVKWTNYVLVIQPTSCRISFDSENVLLQSGYEKSNLQYCLCHLSLSYGCWSIFLYQSSSPLLNEKIEKIAFSRCMLEWIKFE